MDDFVSLFMQRKVNRNERMYVMIQAADALLDRFAFATELIDIFDLDSRYGQSRQACIEFPCIKLLNR